MEGPITEIAVTVQHSLWPGGRVPFPTSSHGAVLSSFRVPSGTPEFSTYFWTAYCVLGSDLGGEGTTVTQENKTFASRSQDPRERGAAGEQDHGWRRRERSMVAQSSEKAMCPWGLSLLSYTNTLVTLFPGSYLLLLLPFAL